MAPVSQSTCSRISTPLYLWFFAILLAVTQDIGSTALGEDRSFNHSTTSVISQHDPPTVLQLTPKNDFKEEEIEVVGNQVANSTTSRQLHASKKLEEEEFLNDNTNEFFGIPGTTQTVNGYDTALGDNPICWVGQAAPSDETLSPGEAQEEMDKTTTTAFPNPLVEDFTLLGKTELLSSCPAGNYLRVEQPIEGMQGWRLRTLRYYNFSLELSVDLDSLQGDFLVSDDKGAAIGLQVVLCTLGKSGFCSPFVHEQANARDDYFGINPSKRVKGDLHGGTHIHSPWVFFDMGNATRLFKVNITIPMIVNEPDDYFVLGTAQLYTGNVSSITESTSDRAAATAAFRYDMANALLSGGGRVLRYQDPPTILRVSTAIHVLGVVCSCIAALIILFYIFQTLWWRKEQVMKLSQADFLLAFLVAALIASFSVFLLEQSSDTYCRLYCPMILIPIQFMYAITVGRLWRIHSVISPLLMEQFSGGRTTWTQSFVNALTKISFVFHRNKRSISTQGLRRQVSNAQLLSIVIIFTLPQVIMQILAGILQPQELQINFNNDESIGRQYCTSSSGSGLFEACFLVLFILIAILLLMAHSANKLPSLLNESQVIYDSTFLSVVLLLMGMAITLVTQGPTTSPDVEYLVWLTVTLSITLNCTYRIVHPKLQKVWSGEQVIVSKLVSDHHRSKRERNTSRLGLSNISGLDFEPPPPSLMTQKSVSVFDGNNSSMQLGAIFEDEPKSPIHNSTNNCTMENEDHDAEAGSHNDANKEKKKTNSIKSNCQEKVDKIAVTIDEAPARGLVLRMMHLQEQLSGINKKIMSGQAVTPTDWANVTEMNAKLEDVFSNHVEFEFELPSLEQSTPLVKHPKPGTDKTGKSFFGGFLKKVQGATDSPPTNADTVEKSDDLRNESEEDLEG